MNAGARLSLYGLGLVVAFGGAFSIAAAVVPETVVAGWETGSETNGQDEGHDAGNAGAKPAAVNTLEGLSLAIDGHVLSPVETPATVSKLGETAEPPTVFTSEALTAGQYLLRLDFQVDGESHNAEFVLDTTYGDGSTNVKSGPLSDEGH